MAALARYAPRYGLEIGEPAGTEWLRVDRLLEPDGPELTELLKRDHDASDHVPAHANALSLMSFHAGRAPATALLFWALEGRVLDIRPHNLWLKPHDGHGIASVALRSAGFLPGGLQTLYDVVLTLHLLPLSAELHRRTPCLYYTSARSCGTVCGSCCLTPREDRLAAYEGGKPILTV